MSLEQHIQEIEECRKLREQGLSQRQIARKLHISRDKVYRRLNAGDKLNNLDPELVRRLQAEGITDLGGLHSGWLKQTDMQSCGSSTGSSFYFYLGKDGEKLDPEQFAEILRNELMQLDPLDPILPPPLPVKHAFGMVFDSDWHFGATISKELGGVPYNREIAENILKAGTSQCHEKLPSCDECLIVSLGDRTHANDDSDATPRNKHRLKVEGTHYENISRSIKAAIWQIQYALKQHALVRWIIVPGNHDPSGPAFHVPALQAEFRNEPRVIIEDFSTPTFIRRRRKVFSAFNHGAGLKPEKLADNIKDVHRREYGRATSSFLFTGHLHNEQQSTFGQLRHFQLPSMVGSGQHEIEMGYADNSGMSAFLFDDRKGLTDRYYAIF